jgi:hypothetical protein
MGPRSQPIEGHVRGERIGLKQPLRTRQGYELFLWARKP